MVGAGRGPLVDRALRAAKNAGRQIEISAVEKNPHAFIGYANLGVFPKHEVIAAKPSRMARASSLVQ